jgi:hypothetical protein
MALGVFDDRSHPPTPAAVRRALGPTARLWTTLLATARALAGPVSEEWNFAGAKFGWSMRVKRGDRILLYLTPQSGAFVVGVVLGDKAVEAARAAGTVSQAALTLVAGAPKYAEGRGVRVQVTSDDELLVAVDLAKMKIGA